MLFGSSGLGSSCSGNVTAAQLALGSVMASAPGACLDPLLCGLSRWLDRSEHDGLNTDDISVYNTPEGILSSEVVPEGVFVPQVVTSKNVRKARGRMRVSAVTGQVLLQNMAEGSGCSHDLMPGIPTRCSGCLEGQVPLGPEAICAPPNAEVCYALQRTR